MMITQAELKENLHYNPDTGDFTWIKPGIGRQMHRKVGCQSRGYRRIKLYGKAYPSHNMRSYKGSTSKFVGVSLFKLKRTKKDGTVSVYTNWRAQTNHLGKMKHLGYFKCETCAALAHDDFVSEHYPEFCKTNFPRLKVSNGR